jgi:hypothetical protein
MVKRSATMYAVKTIDLLRAMMESAPSLSLKHKPQWVQGGPDGPVQPSTNLFLNLVRTLVAA